jgi:MFS family permease
MGISLSGITLTLGNIKLKLAPKGRANWYLAVTTLFSSIALGTAPIIGGLFGSFFEVSEFNWTLNWSSQNNNVSFQILNLQGLDFYFIIAFILGIIALYRLLLVREEGEVKNKIIRNEFLFEITKSLRSVFRTGNNKEIQRATISIYPWRQKRFFKNQKNHKK